MAMKLTASNSICLLFGASGELQVEFSYEVVLSIPVKEAEV